MASACIFCGATDIKITREHVIADWVGKLYAGAAPGTAEIIRLDGSVTSFPVKLFEQTVHAPCEKCNNGWMSVLETQVSKFLGPMIAHGQAKKLDYENMTSLATWAVKTALMLQCIHPAERIVPDEDYRRLYAEKRPPKGYFVWLAHRADLKDRLNREAVVLSRTQPVPQFRAPEGLAAELAQKAIDAGAVIHRSTFSVGHVACLVFGHNFPGHFNMVTGTVKVMQQIWPLQSAVTWPPPHSIETIGGFEGLHDAFNPPHAVL